MSGITSGIGLISGINTADLIEQLMAIEARPVRALEQRNALIEQQRTAFGALSARLLALQESIATFDRPSFFRQFRADSTDAESVSATASETASPGTYSVSVRSLVTHHAVITRGFADANRTPVGPGALTVEVGQGRVNRSTELQSLNGGQGVGRGVIRITDRLGASADVDLTQALTVDDVLDAINDAGIGVRSSVTGVASAGAVGDRIVIEDTTGGTGHLLVADRNGGSAARDLGIEADVAGSRIDSRNLMFLTADSPLSLLNDGLGVDRLRQGAGADDLVFQTSLGSFGVSLSDVLAADTDLRALNSGRGVRLGVVRITDRSGKSVDVDLTDPGQPPVLTAQDVRQRITDASLAAGVSISVTLVNSHYQITDTTDVADAIAKNLKIEDVTGNAAADLGIAADLAADAVIGRDVYRVSTVGNLLNAINYAQGNAGFVIAGISADGSRLELQAAGLGNSVTVQAGPNAHAAEGLGLDGATFSSDGPVFQTRALLGGLNTVLVHSLNGGSGVQVGQVSFTDRAGQSTTIDFSSVKSLQDVVDLINADDQVLISASINRAGNGIVLRDDSNGAGIVTITDVTGNLATSFRLAGDYDLFAGHQVNSGNLQLQYVARQTRLADLNGGAGVTPAAFRIFDSVGAVHVVNLSPNAQSVGEVIDAVNAAGGGVVTARVNDTGDGLVVIDSAGGTKALKIEDLDGNRTAESLRLAGEAKFGETHIDGSFELRVDISARDTLADVAAKINRLGGDLSASVFNDGGPISPFSLTLTSGRSGRGGELLVDTGTLDLGWDTLTPARDAVLTVGDPAGNPLLIARPSNTVTDVFDGVTLNLLAPTDKPVSVTVARDVDALVDQVGSFVKRYNELQDTIDEQTSFDQDTLERGLLQGDATISIVRDRFQRLLLRPFGTDATTSRLFNVGIRLVAGNRLEFNEQTFRDAYEDDPASVEQFFTTAESGFGASIKQSLDDITRDFDGLLARKDQLLSDRQDQLNDRIDQLNVLLDAKRRRLERQFAGLESSLAALQDQQTSLTALSQLAASARGG